ncbi:YybH family protein [Streptosporangium sp. NPDC002721]|uniref:YybH family protein n=1 Tax=Streptosporangium sp. NPDC002721 TaxID=3366188 RepID=UPI0036BED8B5
MTSSTRSAFAPVSDPYQHTENFRRAFNSGEAAAVEAGLEDGAVFVRGPGDPVTGGEASKAIADFLALGLPMDIRDRHVYVADDIALIIADWVVEGTGPGGDHMRMEGTSTDVIRRGADGLWRSVIDNPHGTTRPAA